MDIFQVMLDDRARALAQRSTFDDDFVTAEVPSATSGSGWDLLEVGTGTVASLEGVDGLIRLSGGATAPEAYLFRSKAHLQMVEGGSLSIMARALYREFTANNGAVAFGLFDAVPTAGFLTANGVDVTKLNMGMWFEKKAALPEWHVSVWDNVTQDIRRTTVAAPSPGGAVFQTLAISGVEKGTDLEFTFHIDPEGGFGPKQTRELGSQPLRPATTLRISKAATSFNLLVALALHQPGAGTAEEFTVDYCAGYQSRNRT